MRYQSYERLIVHVDPEPEKTAGGIIKPQGYAGMEKNLRGRVVDSPMKFDGFEHGYGEDFEVIRPLIETGTLILFINGGSFNEGNTYFVKPENVLAILNDETVA